MASAHAYPPIAHHPSTSAAHPISAATALEHISAYLAATNANAALHPDALLTERGPQSSSTNGGLVLHQLRRVEAGLRGEHLGAEVDDGVEGVEADDIAEGEGNKKKAKKDSKSGQEKEGQDGDWQDLGTYQRSGDGLETGEIGARNTGLGDGGEVPAVAVDDGDAEMRDVGEADAGIVDKEARKKAKKEKAKQQKREREERLRLEKEAEI
ncbi:MAG: hypothetical protein M1819_002745 [Sarea resinae]|nr:MAG: hypothetical protein M1819_002745 [Sarea resinae]